MCRQKSCNVAQDGLCAEGYNPVTLCREYIPAGEQIDEPDAEGIYLDTEKAAGITDDGSREPDGIFFSAEVVSGLEADNILRSSLTRLIVIAGSPDSGKTTLVASIYEAFNKGLFAESMFAGCGTFGGFEKRCFTARLVSERSIAETERTLAERTVRFLNISTRDNELAEPVQQMLFADISGEIYQNAQVNSEDAGMLRFVSRADHFVVIIDAGKLEDLSLRQTELASSISIIRSLLDEGFLRDDSYVDILFSRWDKAKASTEVEKIKRFVDHIKSKLHTDFAQKVGRLRFYEVAARPELSVEPPYESILPPLYNLSEVFQGWVNDSPLSKRIWFSSPTRSLSIDEVVEDRRQRRLQ